MKKYSRIIALVLSFLLIFCACKNSENKGKETDTLSQNPIVEEASVGHAESNDQQTGVSDDKGGSSSHSTDTEEETPAKNDPVTEHSSSDDTKENPADGETTVSENSPVPETTSDKETTGTIGDTTVEHVTDKEPPTEVCIHIDSNNDGECDICSVSVIVYIDFYAINDLHGKFADTATNCGVDELTTYLKNRVNIDDNVILLSSGDMWQGSSESNLTKGMIITEWMNHLDFASMTLGNHEYDWGEEFIKANAEIAEFPLLAINIFDRADNERVDYCSASVVIERDGIQIGIIGAIGDCYSSISGDKTEGIYFKTGSELTSLVKTESERLRAQGVDYIVYSIHDGYGSSVNGTTKVSGENIKNYYDVMLSNGYIDLVFEGHTHQNYVLIDSLIDNSGVHHLQGGGDNKGISHVEIAINSANNISKVEKADFVPSSEYDMLPDDPIVEELLDKYSDEIGKRNEVLGYISSPLESDQIRQLVAELYYKEGMELWGEEYDIVLGGGFISTRTPHKLNAGFVKYGDLMSILPFDNKIVLCSINGSDLKSKFFETSNSSYYIFYGDYGEEVKNNIVSSKTYYIVTDTYSSSYSANNLTVIKTLDSEIFARDLLADYISANSTLEFSSIEEIIRIADSLAENTQTTEKYMVECFIKEIQGDKYGNMTVSDGKGNEIYVYGVYGKSGELFEALETKPVVGDKIVLCGSLMKYRGASSSTPVLEFYHTTLEGIIN